MFIGMFGVFCCSMTMFFDFREAKANQVHMKIHHHKKAKSANEKDIDEMDLLAGDFNGGPRQGVTGTNNPKYELSINT